MKPDNNMPDEIWAGRSPMFSDNVLIGFSKVTKAAVWSTVTTAQESHTCYIKKSESVSKKDIEALIDAWGKTSGCSQCLDDIKDLQNLINKEG